VSDAGGDYTLRAVLTIHKQTHYANPDLIANPDYRYWPQGESVPSEWARDADIGSLAAVALAVQADRSALRLDMESNPNAEVPPVVRIAQTVAFPDHFAVWVYPTTSADPADEVYGIEVADGVHQLWILFGRSTSVETQEGQPDLVMIPAPPDQWSRQEVDLAEIYRSLGWSVPLPSLRYDKGLRYTVPQVRLSWIAASRSRIVTTWFFGPFEQEKDRYAPESLEQRGLFQPGRGFFLVRPVGSGCCQLWRCARSRLSHSRIDLQRNRMVAVQPDAL